MRSSHPIVGSSGEASDIESGSAQQPLPAASLDLRSFNSLGSGILQDQVSPDPTIDSRFIVMHGLTTSAAFLCIARILELACMQDSGFNIGALVCTLPPPIAPTIQQQIVPHKPYVDMLPWSSLRDRMLNSLAAINEIEFVEDMMSGDLKVWGSTPWDPTGWEIGPEFAKKWWFLMDEGILRTTNFWRGQRGEEPLVQASV